MVDRIPGDDGEPVLPPHLGLHFIGHDRAGQSGAHDDDFGHFCSSPNGAVPRIVAAAGVVAI